MNGTTINISNVNLTLIKNIATNINTTIITFLNTLTMTSVYISLSVFVSFVTLVTKAPVGVLFRYATSWNSR